LLSIILSYHDRFLIEIYGSRLLEDFSWGFPLSPCESRELPSQPLRCPFKSTTLTYVGRQLITYNRNLSMTGDRYFFYYFEEGTKRLSWH
jgi:hypothetical protein